MPLDINPSYEMTLSAADVEKIIRHYIEDLSGTGKVVNLHFTIGKKYSSDPRDSGYDVFEGVSVRFKPTIDLLKQ